MVLKNAFAAAICAGTLMLGAPALADEYRANEFLALDLSKAVLSPKRLGPEAQFAPVRIEAKTDRAQAQVEPKPEPKIVRTTRVTETPAVAPTRAAPRAAARTKLAKRGNPLDAQARDTRIQTTRIQTWPCKSGGICAWQR